MYPWDPIQKLKMCPPFLAHALARNRSRNGNKKMPLAEIVERSGLSQRTYLRTARMTSWASVKFDVIERFLRGTKVNPWRMQVHNKYLRKHNFRIPYLTKPQQKALDEICLKMSQNVSQS